MRKWSLITHKVHSILSQPVKALEEEQEGEEGNKAWGEVIPEHSECQARLGHRVPGALNEMLMEERKDMWCHINKEADWVHWCHNWQLTECLNVNIKINVGYVESFEPQV